jgi:zinc protease
MSQKQLKPIFKGIGLSLIAILLVVFTHGVALAQIPSRYNDLKFPPLPEIQLPDYERYQLDNGMVVYLVEDHELPLVGGQAIIRTGSRIEPDTQVGLAGITGNLMRTGGTKLHSEDELNLILEQKAASVETSIGIASGGAGFNCLSYDLDSVFKLFAEVLREPVFSETQLELEKTILRGAIARRNDNPGNIASREFSKLIYGNNNPYARTIEYETLDNISRDDVIKFYQEHIRPEQMILGIVGDFDTKEIKKLINDTLGDWKVNTPIPQTTIPEPSQQNTKGVFLVDQPSLTQSNILLGHLGGELSNPDYPVLSVINGVFNGFGGKLNKEVRTRQGLAYSVYGVWRGAYDYPGLFVAGGQTKTETTTDFIKSVLAEIEKIRTNPITTAELNYAKESILNSFVFQFQDPGQTLSRLMTYEYYNYPQDFIFQYQKGVKQATIEDVKRVANEHLKTEKIVTLVVGNSEEIKPSLSSLDTLIKMVDITIPDSQKS